jgi:hypothetical protein
MKRPRRRTRPPDVTAEFARSQASCPAGTRRRDLLTALEALATNAPTAAEFWLIGVQEGAMGHVSAGGS